MTEAEIDVKIMFFASIGELTGTKQLTIQVPAGSKITDLKKILIEKYPVIKQVLSYALCSYNHEYVDEDQFISKNAEVGFFPPVSGGNGMQNDTVIITENKLDINEILHKLTTPKTGAACVFTGFVRQETTRGQKKVTKHLEYESYLPMAEGKMRQICNEIRNKWPLIIKIYMVQRIGVLLPGDITIAIGCSSSHRDEGIFDAARYGIDRMKEIVPVWKKEIGLDGSAWVEGKYIPEAGE
jgi:molybdopterin synthase catalytic subunit